MAVLDAINRARTAAQWFREVGNLTNEELTAEKAAIRQAFGEMDDWLEANQASLNQAINIQARQGLRAVHKLSMLMFLLERRMNKLRAEED